MDYAIEILEATKRELIKDLRGAQALVDIRVMFGEDTSWIQVGREEVSRIESKMADLDSAISRLRGDSV